MCIAIIVTKMYDYVFSENGLVAYKSGELLAIQVYHTTVLYIYNYSMYTILRALRKQWEKRRSKLLSTSVSDTQQT